MPSFPIPFDRMMSRAVRKSPRTMFNVLSGNVSVTLNRIATACDSSRTPSMAPRDSSTVANLTEVTFSLPPAQEAVP